MIAQNQDRIRATDSMAWHIVTWIGVKRLRIAASGDFGACIGE